MIICTFYLTLVFGTHDECPVCVETTHPKYQHSCCGKKLCSKCDEKMVPIDLCLWCHLEGLMNPARGWSKEKSKKSESSVENPESKESNETQSKHDYRKQQFTEYELGQKFELAAESGNRELFDIISESEIISLIPQKYFGDAWVGAALNGHLQILESFVTRLKNNFEKISVSYLELAFNRAYKENHRDMLDFLLKHRFQDILIHQLGQTWLLTARYGLLKNLELISENRFRELSIDDLGDAWKFTLQEAHHEVLETIRFEQIPPYKLGLAWIGAVYDGDYAKVEFLSKRKQRFGEIIRPHLGAALRGAAHNGNGKVIEFLLQANHRFKDIPQDDLTNALKIAKRTGHRESYTILRKRLTIGQTFKARLPCLYGGCFKKKKRQKEKGQKEKKEKGKGQKEKKEKKKKDKREKGKRKKRKRTKRKRTKRKKEKRINEERKKKKRKNKKRKKEI